MWAHTAISWNKKETRSIPVTLLPINQMMQNEELGVILRRLHSHGLQEMTTRTKHCFVQVDVKSPVHRNMAEKTSFGYEQRFIEVPRQHLNNHDWWTSHVNNQIIIRVAPLYWPEEFHSPSLRSSEGECKGPTPLCLRVRLRNHMPSNNNKSFFPLKVSLHPTILAPVVKILVGWYKQY